MQSWNTYVQSSYSARLEIHIYYYMHFLYSARICGLDIHIWSLHIQPEYAGLKSAYAYFGKPYIASKFETLGLPYAQVSYTLCKQLFEAALFIHTGPKLLCGNCSRDPEVTETAKFVGMFDKLFDCLNVPNFFAGKKARKLFQEHWRREDFRFNASLVSIPFFKIESTIRTL